MQLTKLPFVISLDLFTNLIRYSEKFPLLFFFFFTYLAIPHLFLLNRGTHFLPVISWHTNLFFLKRKFVLVKLSLFLFFFGIYLDFQKIVNFIQFV
ncbi:hypothetical protein EDC94DRAFT_164940 [Helicostylum pulchrum]|nr:hypothetical protein EDC94DRAFT_164940 [Helicostylum pulchrum]